MWKVVTIAVLALAAGASPAAATPTGAISMDASEIHGCALRPDTTLTCWSVISGDNPTPPAGTFKAVSAGMPHECAIRTDGRLACWGQNDAGQTNAPAGTFKALQAGDWYSCAIRTDDTVACWGRNDDGRASAPGGTFKALAVSPSHTCAIRTDDTLACWGSPADQLTTPPSGTFKALAAAQGSHECAIRSDDTLACWGESSWGKANPPVGTFKAVVTGRYHSCAIRTDGTLACWGLDIWGQSTPPGGTFKAISTSELYTCAIRSDDTLACWGRGYGGETRPPAGTFKELHTTRQHSCGIRTDRSVTCWGDNYNGSTDVPPALADTGPPELTVPADRSLTATSADGATVSFVLSAMDAYDASPAVACSRPSGAMFALGETIVACTASDAAGNSAAKLFTVTVRDAIAFDELPSATYGDALTPAATSATGRPVVFAASGACAARDRRIVTTGAGTCVVTAETAAGLPHPAAPVERTVAVGRRDLTVTAADVTRREGDAEPELTGTVDGLVNGDAISVRYVSEGTGAGAYPIAVAVADSPVLARYRLVTRLGTLTILAANPPADVAPADPPRLLPPTGLGAHGTLSLLGGTGSVGCALASGAIAGCVTQVVANGVVLAVSDEQGVLRLTSRGRVLLRGTRSPVAAELVQTGRTGAGATVVSRTPIRLSSADRVVINVPARARRIPAKARAKLRSLAAATRGIGTIQCVATTAARAREACRVLRRAGAKARLQPLRDRRAKRTRIVLQFKT